MIQCAVDMLLMHYAAGSLEAAESLIAAAHLALSPEGRRKVARYEAVGGCLITTMPEARVSDECLEAVLGFIDRPAAQEQAAPGKPRDPCDGRLALPDCIRNILDGHCQEFAMVWSTAQDGMDFVDLRICTPQPCHRKVQLIYLPPNFALPDHSHEGLEITVVLNGSFSDANRRYTAGDIIIIDDPATAHAPRTDSEGCLCLCLMDGELHLRIA